MKSGVLYISYDGMLEPLGQSQVIAYLERLAANRTIHLISFEKPEDWRDEPARSAILDRLRDAGIQWHPRRYHRHPTILATIWDIVVGIACALWLISRHGLRTVHARSYVPSVVAMVAKRLLGTNFIFDMRGFWVDERVDGGLWARDSWIYQSAKWCERRFVLGADHIVSLTKAAVEEINRFDYVRGRMLATTVIPTCADLQRFQPAGWRQDGFTLGYVGSAGTWYLFDELVECFIELMRQRPDARLLIINRNEHDFIRRRLELGGVPAGAFELRAASHVEIPIHMARMHAAAFFIKPAFSKKASAPTKLGELLGCGLPCLTNQGVGDLADILEEGNVGVAVENFERATLAEGIRRLLEMAADPRTSKRCRAVANRHFSLDEGVARYESVYRQMDGVR